MSRFFVAAAVAAVCLSGCASSSIVVGNPRAPISPDLVRVYVDPPARFDKIAIVDAGSRNSWALTDQGKTNKVIQRMKKEAGRLGANGILLSGVGDQQVGSVGSGQAWGYGNTAYGLGVQSGVFQKKGQGMAIYAYPEAATTSPLPSETKVTINNDASARPASQEQSDVPSTSVQQPAAAAQRQDAGWRGWGKKD